MEKLMEGKVIIVSGTNIGKTRLISSILNGMDGTIRVFTIQMEKALLSGLSESRRNCVHIDDADDRYAKAKKSSEKIFVFENNSSLREELSKAKELCGDKTIIIEDRTGDPIEYFPRVIHIKIEGNRFSRLRTAKITNFLQVSTKKFIMKDNGIEWIENESKHEWE